MIDETRSSAAPPHQGAIIDAAWRQVAQANVPSGVGGATVGLGARAGRWAAAWADAIPGYRILDEVHRGGQGVVYRAIQESTSRTVALKVMLGGAFAGPHARNRFAREVQILAELRHPNIVTIHDSGQAGDAQYFVMDYVEGRPLDRFVAETAPLLAARLRLFASICEAVNAAHLRGIIHRDLKPSNILVVEEQSAEKSSRDSKRSILEAPASRSSIESRLNVAAPRVLDFGLARRADEADEPLTALTVTGQFVGSLPWASPEQAQGRHDQIDLRTDVYALGVLLYQLLTGVLPYDVTGGIDSALHNIIHADPADPRTRNRQLDDDLSTIVLKALRKEREHRYETAGSLGRDVERYLAGEPIEAKRDNSWYVMRRMIRRNRGRATVAALLIAAAVWSVGLLIHGYRKETGLRAQAESALEEARRQSDIAAAVNEFLNADLLASVSPEAMGREVTMRAVLDKASKTLGGRFADKPAVKAELQSTLGKTYLALGELGLAVEHFEAALNLHREATGRESVEAASLASHVASVYDQQGRLDEAERLLREALATFERVRGPDDPGSVKTRGDLGWLLTRKGRYEEAERLVRQARDATVRAYGPDHEQSQYLTNGLATVLRVMGRATDAEALQKEAVEAARRLYGPEHPDTLVALANLAEVYKELRRDEEAERLFREVLDNRRRVLGPVHPQTIRATNNLAVHYASMRRDTEAAALFEECLRTGPESLNPEHPTLIAARSNLGQVYDRLGRHAEAEPLHRAAVAGGKGYLPAEHPLLGLYIFRLGRCLLGLERPADAEPVLREAYPMFKKGGAAYLEDARECATDLAACCEAIGKPVEAAGWRQKAVPTSQDSAGAE